MIPADLLAELKAYLGIPAGDTSGDAWLTAQAEVVLDAMRGLTGRWLYPPAPAADAFALPTDPCHPIHCGACACPPVQLAQIPVQELTAIEGGDTARDLAAYEVDSGGVLRTAADHRPVPVPWAAMRVAYVAGWAELPATLKAALFDLVGGAWTASGRGVAPGGGGPPPGVTKVSVIDVGSIEYADATGAGGAPPDPILGRYSGLVARYTDLAASIGGHPCRVTAMEIVP